MKKRWREIAGALYLAGAVVTFGHAAAHTRCAPGIFHDECNIEVGASTGMMGAMLWPLYWSWVAWS